MLNLFFLLVENKRLAEETWWYRRVAFLRAGCPVYSLIQVILSFPLNNNKDTSLSPEKLLSMSFHNRLELLVLCVMWWTWFLFFSTLTMALTACWQVSSQHQRGNRRSIGGFSSNFMWGVLQVLEAGKKILELALLSYRTTMYLHRGRRCRRGK